MVGFLKLLLKIFAVLIGLALLSGLGFYLYDQYQKSKELDYPSAMEWSWHSYPWQITDDGDYIALRKVDLDDRYQLRIGVFLDEESGLQKFWVRFWFEQDCAANTEIETDITYSDGTNYKLRCLEDGDRLFTSFSRSVEDSSSHTFSFDWGGFSAFARISDDELRPLIRAAALTTAQPVETE